MFIIGGIQKTTLIDFPQKVAAIVFTQGCNFCCGYCHNPELIKTCHSELVSEAFSTEKIFSFLKTRIGKLDGVVITGGEPTIQKDLYDFVKKIKSMGFSVKLDTNGTNPAIIEKLIKENLLDYIAMDIKAPLDKYQQITSVKCGKDNIQKSINLIMNSNIDYEFRTTVVKSQLSFDDFNKIGLLIQGAKRYYLQKFIPTKLCDEKLKNEQTYENQEFEEICKMLKKYIHEVSYR